MLPPDVLLALVELEAGGLTVVPEGKGKAVLETSVSAPPEILPCCVSAFGQFVSVDPVVWTVFEDVPHFPVLFWSQ